MEVGVCSLQTRNGDTEMLLYPGAPEGLAWFHSLRSNIGDFTLYRVEKINIAKIIQSLKNRPTKNKTRFYRSALLQYQNNPQISEGALDVVFLFT